ncbi:antibiotic biosynthesis monooxygenase [uncultured Cellulomonas sp.]|uniref:putative quinol monooxygenase n=1 Tax=uncultured Cellulomonas sp. TaxID=189682 RepID=UPI0028E6720A|nr:antibiotic biosynthesis monooxygenase [uncultured Cellulomonas sp.]
MTHSYVGTMRTLPERRAEVVAILLRDVSALAAVGCRSYVVSVVDDDDDLIAVSEVWESAADHAASLELPSVRAAIAEAMPMLTGEFTGVAGRVVGGLRA